MKYGSSVAVENGQKRTEKLVDKIFIIHTRNASQPCAPGFGRVCVWFCYC